MKHIILLALVSLCCGQPAVAESKTNVLILLADDLGYADVGFNGGNRIATPNLDRLAATGVKLTNFQACPMCSPTRAGLLTGRWPLRFGMMRAVLPPWSNYGLPTEEVTLPELLASAGYGRRGIVGKWHLGHAERRFLPLENGFTRFVGCYNGAIDYFTHEREGEVDWHHDRKTVVEEGYATDLIADEAVRFISESPADAPWLLYVPFTAPHSPQQAKQEDLRKYAHLKQRQRRTHAAMVDSLDQAIGRILTAVEARADVDNTLVLFFSDNGGIPRAGSSNSLFREGKLTVYEGGTRVCAAIRWPAGGLSGGTEFGGRIGYIDVVPSILAAAAIPLPGNLDGINIFPALRGERTLPDRPWFSYMHQSETAHAAVYQGDWKLIAHGDAFAEEPVSEIVVELYDLAADPAETRDVSDEHPEIVGRLQALLREFGTYQRAGVGAYSSGRNNFTAPIDWNIE